MTITNTEIVSQEIQRDDKIKLVFIHHLSNGTALGPIVEYRPSEENIEYYLVLSKILYEASINREAPAEAPPESEYE